MKIRYADIRTEELPLYVQHIIVEILDREGGRFTAHENDHPTKWGIRKLSADEAGYRGKIEDISRDTAAKIWVSLFWYKPNMHRIGRISPLIAETVMDTSGPAGLRVGVQHLQKALTSFNAHRFGEHIYGHDLVFDGLIGKATIGMLDKFLKHRKIDGGERVLASRLNCLQDAHYTSVALNNVGKRDFSYGWSDKRVFADLMDLAGDPDIQIA